MEREPNSVTARRGNLRQTRTISVRTTSQPNPTWELRSSIKSQDG